MLAEELVKEWVFLFKVFFSLAERSAIIFPANSKKSSHLKYFLALFSRIPLACLFSAFFCKKPKPLIQILFSVSIIIALGTNMDGPVKFGLKSFETSV